MKVFCEDIEIFTLTRTYVLTLPVFFCTIPQKLYIAYLALGVLIADFLFYDKGIITLVDEFLYRHKSVIKFRNHYVYINYIIMTDDACSNK